MVLILVGLIHGSVYAAFFLEGLREGALNLEKEAFEEIGGGSPDPAGALQKWEQSHNYRKARSFNRSSHSHFLLMGLTGLVFAPYLAKTVFGRITKYLLAAATLFGSALLPSGVFLEIWREEIGSIMAMLGGTVFLLALLVITTGYILYVCKDTPG